MKNQKNVIEVKKENVSKSENLKNQNISKIEKEVKKEKEIKDKIYKFDYELSSSDSLKSKRQSTRKKLSSFVSKIVNYSDLQKDNEKLKEEIKNFIIFYKETYVKNNFELNSLRSNFKNEIEKKDHNRMLEIIKNNK